MPITTDVVSSNFDQCEVYNIMWHSLSVTCHRSVVFSWSSGFLHQENWPLRNNWNIVESGVKHHKPHQTILWTVEISSNRNTNSLLVGWSLVRRSSGHIRRLSWLVIGRCGAFIGDAIVNCFRLQCKSQKVNAVLVTTDVSSNLDQSEVYNIIW